jgi:hypothetical protein
MKRWSGKSNLIELSDIQTRRESENVFNLDYCRLIMDGDSSDLSYFYPLQTKIFQHHGFDKNPWVSASQYRRGIVERDTFSAGSGFIVEFPFFVDSRFETIDLRLVVERPYLYEVKVNGDLLEPLQDEWWLDKGFGVFRISGNIEPGDNSITLTADPMSIYCELEPVYFIGDFDVLALDKGWLLASSSPKSPGSWKKQGMPFYSDVVSYSSEFNLNSSAPTLIKLPSWKGSVAAVEVNGEKAGLILRDPGELRIDPYIHKGKNEITVRIYGTLKNLLGPHHSIKQRGIVTPWSFKYAPEEQVSGVDYDLLDYGLLEAFEIESIEKK